MTNASDFLLGGGGGQSARFETIGDTVTGQIISAEVKQQTEIGTGAPLTWDNGDPRMQLVVRLQTTLCDPSDPDDDGVRAIYVKGSKKAGSRSMHDAVAQAVRAAGAKGLDVGGTLSVQYVATEPSSTRGFNDRKLFAASYTPPSPTAAAASFLGAQQAPTQQAPAPQPPAAMAPQAQPAAPQLPDMPQGVDPAVWAQLQQRYAAGQA